MGTTLLIELNLPLCVASSLFFFKFIQSIPVPVLHVCEPNLANLPHFLFGCIQSNVCKAIIILFTKVVKPLIQFRLMRELILFSIKTATFNPLSTGDTLNHIVGQEADCFAKPVNDMIQRFKHLVLESHSAKLLPDLLYGIHFRCVRRYMQ